jgi:hypothetical protein
LVIVLAEFLGHGVNRDPDALQDTPQNALDPQEGQDHE